MSVLTQQIGNLNEEMKTYQKSSDKLAKLNTFMIKMTHKMNTCKKEHEFFEKNHVCPTCTQELSEEFRDDKLKEGKTKLDEMNLGFDEIKMQFKKNNLDLKSLLNYLLRLMKSIVVFHRQTFN